MKDVLQDARSLKPLSLLGIAGVAVLTIGISYNALLGQSGHNEAAVTAGIASKASTRIDVVATPTRQNTIVLRYNPQIEDVQRGLLATGDYKGQVDGVNGRQTRVAIENYQKKSGLAVTGEATAELIDHIKFTRQITEAAQYTGSVAEVPEDHGSAQIRQLQTALADLGYAPGEITGTISPATKEAITKFEHDRGLTETGKMSDALLAEIAKMTDDSMVTATN